MYQFRLSLAAAAFLAVALSAAAPQSLAQAGSPLVSELHALRAAAGCPALQPDPALERVAQAASQNTKDYLAFRTAAVPFTDPSPMLTTIGHPVGKSIMLSGYGRTVDDAVRGMQLHYRSTKPDCSFVQFGTNLLDDDSGFYIATVVLATPGSEPDE